MTYEQFESAILTYINTTWDQTKAVLIGEYYSKAGSADSTIEVSIGVETEAEAELGKIGDTSKRMSILAGTVNLLLSLPSDVGRTKALEIIGAARALLHYKSVTNYDQFTSSIKKPQGNIDGKTVVLIICPFTIEINE